MTARYGETKTQRRLFGETKHADVRGLVDMAEAGIPMEFGALSDAFAQNSIETKLQIRTSNGVRQKKVDALMNRNAEIGVDGQSEWRARGFRNDSVFRAEGYKASRLPRCYESGERQQVVIAGGSR